MAKLTGEELAIPEPVAEAPALDLMEALRLSVAEAKQARMISWRSRPSSSESSSGVRWFAMLVPPFR